MPVIPRYQPRGGPRTDPLTYASAYDPPNGSDWRLFGNAVQAAGAVANLAEPLIERWKAGRDNNETKEKPPQGRDERDGATDQRGAKATTTTPLQGATGGLASGAAAAVAAGSVFADNQALGRLVSADLGQGEAVSEAASAAYAPVIAAAKTPEERAGLEANRDSLAGFWAQHGEQLKSTWATADHKALADQAFQIASDGIARAPTYDAVEGLAQRQMVFIDTIVRQGQGDPAVVNAQRLELARKLRGQAELSKARLDPVRYLRLSGSEGLDAALAWAEVPVSDADIQAEGRFIGRSDLAGLSPEALAQQTGNPELRRQALESRFDRALQRYDGDRTLALASFLAGPEAVDGWLEKTGDPRDGEMSHEAWVQAIPDAQVRDRIRKIDGALAHGMSGLLTPQARAEAQRVARDMVNARARETDQTIIGLARDRKIDEAWLTDGISSGRIDPKRPATVQAMGMVREQARVERQAAADQDLMARVHGGQARLDVGKPGHLRAMEADFAAGYSRVAPDRRGEFIFTYAGNVRTMPQGALRQLDRLLKASSEADLGEAATAYVALREVAPSYLEGISPEARQRGEFLWIARARAPEQEGIRQLIAQDRLGPDLVKRREDSWGRLNREAPGMWSSMLRRNMLEDPGMKNVPGLLAVNMFKDPSKGIGPVTPGMIEDYQEMARSFYLRNGDLKGAYIDAWESVRQRWQISYINQTPQFMRRAPDRLFIHFKGKGGASITDSQADAAVWQRAQVAARFHLPNAGRVRFKERPGYLSGPSKPMYEIYYVQPDGRWEPVREKGKAVLWTPDVAGEQRWRDGGKKEWAKAERAREAERVALANRFPPMGP